MGFLWTRRLNDIYICQKNITLFVDIMAFIKTEGIENENSNLVDRGYRVVYDGTLFLDDIASAWNGAGVDLEGRG